MEIRRRFVGSRPSNAISVPAKGFTRSRGSGGLCPPERGRSPPAVALRPAKKRAARRPVAGLAGSRRSGRRPVTGLREEVSHEGSRRNERGRVRARVRLRGPRAGPRSLPPTTPGRSSGSGRPPGPRIGPSRRGRILAGRSGTRTCRTPTCPGTSTWGSGSPSSVRSSSRGIEG